MIQIFLQLKNQTIEKDHSDMDFYTGHFSR